MIHIHTQKSKKTTNLTKSKRKEKKIIGSRLLNSESTSISSSKLFSTKCCLESLNKVNSDGTGTLRRCRKKIYILASFELFHITKSRSQRNEALTSIAACPTYIRNLPVTPQLFSPRREKLYFSCVNTTVFRWNVV